MAASRIQRSPARRGLPRTGWLSTPLTGEERRRVTVLYREHGGLVKMMGRKMSCKYRCVRPDEIFSCIDIAFIKCCRAWDPAKGTFSTLLTHFCEGEIRHYIRDFGWMIKAPGHVRLMGQKARRLLQTGLEPEEVCEKLNVSLDELKDGLKATVAMEHEIKGFGLHICPRPTPWEVLVEAEAKAAAQAI